MTASALNRDKLGKLLAMLTSDHDGEVVAAARAAVRMLAAAGMRPEELAAEPAPAAAVMPRPRSNFDTVMADIATKLRERVDALELELEPHRPELDWVALADRLRLPQAMEYRARTGKLTMEDRVFIRRALTEAEAARAEHAAHPAQKRRARR